MKPTSASTYERARRLANLAVWTIDLQRRRLRSPEPEDDKFVLRKWSDFHFFIWALVRLRRSALLATNVPEISDDIRKALRIFDAALPNITKMRDVAEHIDDYALDRGRNSNLTRTALEIGSSNGDNVWNWLGFEIDTNEALLASVALFDAIKDCMEFIKTTPEGN